MKKKAQAAFEFLANYSWALLVIVVIAGMLIYFTSDSTTSLPDSCTLGSNTCKAFSVQENYSEFLSLDGSTYSGYYGIVKIDIQNPEYDKIEINDVEFNYEDENLLTECENIPFNVSTGQPIELRCNVCKTNAMNCIDILGSKDMETLEIKITYNIEGDTFSKFLQGEIISHIDNKILEGEPEIPEIPEV